MKFGNKRTIIYVIVCLITAAGSFLFFAGGSYLQNKQTDSYLLDEGAKEGQYVMPEIAYQEQLAQMQQSYFRIQINARPTVDKQTGKCNLMIGNPGENHNDVRVHLVMDETGKEIYQSEILSPGERSPYAMLDDVPEPGEYAATAIFNVIEQDGERVIGEIEAGIELTVEP